MTEQRGLALPSHALERIEEFLGPQRRLGVVRPLPLKRLVADYCEKLIALDQAGTPVAFVAVSPPTHPTSVGEAAASTLAIRDALGPVLGESVLVPAFVGEIDGCSYSITAYCEPVSTGRWLGRWQRMRLGPEILSWLANVTRHSVSQMTAADDTVRLSLEALARHPGVDVAVRAAADAALAELAQGRWTPRRVVAHNDLWWGNFVRRARHAAGTPPFHVIDWAGGRLDGMPIYDLVRVAMSLRMNATNFRKALLEHCTLLGCEESQASHYLCAAFGALSLNLGEWPEAQFALTASSCLQYAAAARASPHRPGAGPQDS